MFIHLADHDIQSAWAHHSWTKIYNWPEKEKTLVFVPLHGFADWGMGLGLDTEETIGSAVLKDALAKSGLGTRVLVTPPIRFQPQPFANAAFSLDWDTAYEMADSILESIKLTGFKKVILFNTGPYNEQFTDVLGRDMRIKHELQMFCVNISGLGLDLHPYRQAAAMGMGSSDRTPVETSERKDAQTLAAFLCQQAATPGAAPIPNDAYELAAPKNCPAEATGVTLEEANAKGPAILDKAGTHLARLIAEIDERAPLPHDGKIIFKTDYKGPSA